MKKRFYLQVSPVVLSRLGKENCKRIAAGFLRKLASDPTWRPGRCSRVEFTANGRGYVCGFDFRPSGKVVAMFGLPQEVTTYPTDGQVQPPPDAFG